MHGFTSLNTFIYLYVNIFKSLCAQNASTSKYSWVFFPIKSGNVRNEKLCETFSIQWTYSNIKFLKMNEPNIIILLSFFNHFIKIWLTCEKLYIFNLYNFMSLEVSIHLCTITTIYAINISITPRSVIPPSLFVDIILLIRAQHKIYSLSKFLSV